jgi:hypothetical protein
VHPSLRNSFSELEKRAKNKALGGKGEYQDMLQWLVDTAQGKATHPERLVKLMLVLNMAAIHTISIIATNVFLDLCARSECIGMIREEISQVLKKDGGTPGGAGIRGTPKWPVLSVNKHHFK